LSRDLLEVLARAAAGLRVLIVVNYRPGGTAGDLAIQRLPDFREIELTELLGDDAAALIRSKLDQVHAAGQAEVEPRRASEDLIALVTERSGGNPFYIEELISFLVARGVDPADPGALEALELPESLHSLVLSRIDTLVEAPRRTLKVASVVGRVFEAPVLPGAYPELGSLDAVVQHLDELRGADLVNLDREADQAYLFKHVATQEVAYESLPFAVRRLLHGRIGTYLEAADPDAGDRQLDLLAHHFWNSDDDDRKRTYLQRAADAARAAYANAAAIDYLERVIPGLADAERVDRAEAIVQAVRDAAVGTGDVRLVARCDHSLAESARRLGRFADAEARLDSALEGFRTVEDDRGAAEALQVMGTVAAQRGDPDRARSRYLESLEIRERIGDEAGVAALRNNLGIVAQQQGDGAAARTYAQQALDLYTGLGDRRRIGTCHVNLAWMDSLAGDQESARARCEEAIRLAREVGDRLNLAIAQNNLGDALRDLGRLDEAGRAYAEAVATYRDLNDLGPLMALLEDVAVLAVRRGQHSDAITLLGAADALRGALGAARSSAAEGALLEQLDPSLVALGASEAAAIRGRGSALPVDGAIELAIEAAVGAVRR
jgi:tetratricopeptide (TPR) repeat protein